VHNVYGNGSQLGERIRVDFVNSFGMINTTRNIGYYLFHGARDKTGVKLMKAGSMHGNWIGPEFGQAGWPGARCPRLGWGWVRWWGSRAGGRRPG
jgi:hypothetical protein